MHKIRLNASSLWPLSILTRSLLFLKTSGVASSTLHYTLPYCYVRQPKTAADQSTVYVDKILFWILGLQHQGGRAFLPGLLVGALYCVEDRPLMRFSLTSGGNLRRNTPTNRARSQIHQISSQRSGGRRQVVALSKACSWQFDDLFTWVRDTKRVSSHWAQKKNFQVKLPTTTTITTITTAITMASNNTNSLW